MGRSRQDRLGLTWRDRWAISRHFNELGLAAFIIVAGLGIGVIETRSAKLGAVALAGMIMLAFSARRPVVLAVVATGAVFAVQRLGGTSVTPGSTGGLSYSDALIAAASVMSLPALAGTPELHRLRTALRGTAVYLALLLPGVIANPSMRAYLEWAHRLVLVGGSLVVGAWLVREHCVRPALRLLTIVASIIGAASIEWTFTHNFGPASPFHLNKNFIGALLGAVIVLVLVASREIDIGLRTRILVVLLVGGGLAASQSRGGALAGVAGLLVAFALDLRRHNWRTQVLAALVGIGLAGFAYVSVHDQLTQNKDQLNTNSVGVRFNVEKAAHRIWRSSPIVGVGLKYFNTGRFGEFALAPNNDIDNELAESGVIGLAGWVLMEVTILGGGIRRRTTPLAAAGVGILAGSILHGMVDIYWTAGVAATPFLILGMAYASEPPPEPLQLGGAIPRFSRFARLPD